MGIIKPTPETHLFVAIMYNCEKDKQRIITILKQKYGELLGEGPIYNVTDFTNYYRKEFGADLKKQMFVFKEHCSLEILHEIKIFTNDLEIDRENKEQGKRIINIDPGYLEPSKLVLFSTKDFSHRIYLGKGIFGEITMLYMHGEFKILGWTYADYSAPASIKFLKQMRNQIVNEMRHRKISNK